MPLYLDMGGADWVLATNGESPSGPLSGFDTDLGRPVWRHPSGTSWVDALGNVIAGVTVGRLCFACSENSALVAML